MMIAFTCIFCEEPFQAPEELAGRRCRCKRCGTVLTIPTPGLPLLPAAPRPAPASEAPEPRPGARSRKRRKPKAIGHDGWVSLAIGAGLAAVALTIPLAGLVPDVLITLLHEVGHVATAWLFGSPAVPSFDLSYGGGVSYALARQPLLLLLIYAGFAYLAFQMRDDRPRLIMVLIAVVLYTAAAFTPTRDLLITAMGHGAELLFAGVFLYRALSGSQILRSQERPLYAFLGLYIVLDDARFAYRLIASPEHREAYGEAKGGGHTMDFSRIANEHLHVRLEVVATLFLVACALPPLAAFLAHRRSRVPDRRVEGRGDWR